ncbi:MAG: ABC transporter ATP-binding protein [Pseudomonadota bacterium]
MSRHFRLGSWARRRVVHAVDDVDLDIHSGEMLGIVGESGCGKSTLGRLLIGLDRPTGGRITIDGAPLPTGVGPAFRRSRKQLQYVFQDPLSALNPRLTIGFQIEEVLRVHRLARQPATRAIALLDAVGLGPEHGERYVHQLSGGQRQRALVARTLAVEPGLVIFDEPVSALDLSVQAQMIDLIAMLRRRLGLTGVFISHDLRVVRYVSDRIAVMYLGRIVEIGAADEVFHQPLHPYTQALLGALLSLDPERRRGPRRLLGDPPDPFEHPPGCSFHPRCPQAAEVCRRTTPGLSRLADGRLAACHALPGPAA